MRAMQTPIFQLDAFASRLFAGNPAAVMPMAAMPEPALMQAIAAENNLAETAFIVRDGADYRIRWFTPSVEVPLCGHATLASAAVVMERLEPARRAVEFQSASGRLGVARTSAGYRLDFPARHPRQVEAPAQLAAALGARPAEVWADEANYLVRLASAAEVRALAPDFATLERLDREGVVVTAAGDAGFDCVSRCFFPKKGIPEDPVTGSAHCGLTPFWAARLGRRELRAFQASKRGGELRCVWQDERVLLEGECRFYLEGSVDI